MFGTKVPCDEDGVTARRAQAAHMLIWRWSRPYLEPDLSSCSIMRVNTKRYYVISFWPMISPQLVQWCVFVANNSTSARAHLQKTLFQRDHDKTLRLGDDRAQCYVFASLSTLARPN